MIAETEVKFSKVEEAIEDIKNGKLIIVVDDEDRENEGDFIGAAEMVNPEMINFMATHGRGLICTPLTPDLAEKMELTPMVKKNTDLHGTAFTISIDYRKKGCTTGISAYDRATGIQALCDEHTQADDYARPGHIFPLVATKGGVLRRSGHTEAAVDLAILAGKKPIGVLVEILNPDGTMARLPELMEIAKNLDLKIISIEELIAYRLKKESLIQKELEFEMETEYGKFNLIAFSENDSDLCHLALTKGSWTIDEAVLTRVHSSTNTGDLISLFLKNQSNELSKWLKAIEQEGKGVYLLLRQEESKNELLSTLKRLSTQKEKGEILDPHPKNTRSTVERNIGVGAQILNALGVKNMKLLTDNIDRRFALHGYDLEITEYISVK